MTTGNTRLVLPALRGILGDWIYYVTTINLTDVAERVALAQDIHDSKTLNDLIQRQVSSRAQQIADYLIAQPQRFFNALVVAVYGGMPQWYELAIKANDLVSENDISDDIEGRIGCLVFTGDENLFAIDGQHRVVGIREAVKRSPQIGSEQISAIFVAHRKDLAGMERTRRLFTTLNRYAKPVSQLEKIAMDEDDIVAIVTRRLVNEYSVLRESVSEVKGKNISINDNQNITTLVALYDSIDRYLGNSSEKWTTYKKLRPPDTELDSAFDRVLELWDVLTDTFEPLRRIKDGEPAGTVVADNRSRAGGHVILRPIGLEMVVVVIRALREQGLSFDEIVTRLSKVPMTLEKEPWVGLLWEPRNRRIIYRAENQRVAIRLLFHGLGGNLTYFKTDEARLRMELTGLLHPESTTVPVVNLPRFG